MKLVKGLRPLRMVRLIDFFVARAPYRRGRFITTAGLTNPSRCTRDPRPDLRVRVPGPQRVRPRLAGPAITEIGPDLFAIRVTFTAQMARKNDRGTSTSFWDWLSQSRNGSSMNKLSSCQLVRIDRSSQ
jgi:hypothetical protein